MKQLYKSSTNKQIMGVCGGLAEYFNVDTTVIRLVFGISFFVFGFGFMPYIILGIILPYDYQVNNGAGTVYKRPSNDSYVYRNNNKDQAANSFGSKKAFTQPKDVTPSDSDVWSDF